MIVAAALYVLLTLINVKAEFHTSRLSVEEGKVVTLRCAFPGGNGSGIQWVTPKGYTSYFNGEKVLKDRRYQLLQSSGNKLIIHLSNVTRADEGVYSCLYYSSPMQTKKVRVSVLAVPSPPSLKVIRIPGKGLKEKYNLTCMTSGSHPCPKLTWLIDDHTEVFGHQNLRLQTDGRCTAISTLRVSMASHTSRARCVVRHRTLIPGNLTASYSFHTLSTVTESQINENTHHHPSGAVISTTSVEEYTTHNVKTSGIKREDETRVQGTSSSILDTTDVNLTSASNEEVSSTGNLTAAENTEENTTDRVNGSVTAEIVTPTSFPEENSSLVIDVTITGNSNNVTDYDMESFKRESYRSLILALVSVMLFVFLVIVYLFVLKLRKAHYSWKKENETSDQTLESTKSRSNNEETTAPAAPGQDQVLVTVNANHKVPGIQYNSQVPL
ncbi:cytotoxic and regulatory T-cell molecule isoform X1 [Bufo gargarizans]|uniref:cytotoxic and regulatory T-cell molecule isoform X1 n=1 Tax=Bufo gargarizans TaxID=30331 RepID=UPI001CF2FC04|nr:cytotoxic and regulatory T-cell molecule isoform X1 [Bufo gargarizans]